MSRARLERVLLVLLLAILCSNCSIALIVPHGISGYVFELDGITQARDAHFSINNTKNRFFLSAKTGRNSDTGKYVATVNGENGDAIIVKVWNDYHESSRTVVLAGVMYNVNLMINTTQSLHPPVISSTPVKDTSEDQIYTYQAQAFDEDGDDLIYLLQESPESMSINSSSGLVKWMPTNKDVGSHTILIEVNDSVFKVNQSFVLVVHNTNDAPVITTFPLWTAKEDDLYLYDVNASDEDKDAITYLLVSAPTGMVVNSSSGLIRWTPLNADVGKNYVEVLADDGNGGRASQSFNITVENVNDAPHIVSVPPPTAVQGVPYIYGLEAFDEDNDPLFFSLADYPAGMNVNPATGLINWTPTNAQVGLNNVTVVVSDGSLSAEQSFAINVSNVNDLPLITSLPVTTAYEDEIYQYEVEAMDPDNDYLSYSLLVAPAAMTVNKTTGLIHWTPTHPDVGPHDVTVAVSDNDGSALQPYVLEVKKVNHPPSIKSSPVVAGMQDTLYQYDVDATDVDGDTLGYHLVVAPAGMSIDISSGLILWTPNALQVGNKSVMIVVSDGYLNDSQSFIVDVENVNDPPFITTTPVLDATVGVVYVYDVNATDIDNNNLTFSLVEAPSGMTIDSHSGIIRWLPRQKDIGENKVMLTVNDGLLLAAQDYTMTVVDYSNCIMKCHAGLRDCSESAKEENRQCKRSGVSALEECDDGCWFFNKKACKMKCRTSYFSALHQCSATFKAANSACSKNRIECLEDCHPQRDGAKAKSFTEDVSTYGSSVASVVVKVLSDIAPEVEITRLAQRPVTVEATTNLVYEYLSIEQLNLEDELIAGANITFYVQKSWLQERGLEPEDIVLRRFHNNAWQTLPTKIVRSDDSRVYYVADTSGFSYFAISVKPDADVKTEEYVARNTLKEQFSVSGILFDGKGNQVEWGTNFTITNLRTEKTFEGVTGIGNDPGAFFIIVDADPSDEFVFTVPNLVTSKINISEDIDFANFVVDNKSQEIVVERTGPSHELESQANSKKTQVTGNTVSSAEKASNTGKAKALTMAAMSILILLVSYLRLRRKSD